MDIKGMLRAKLDEVVDSMAVELRKAFIEELLAGSAATKAVPSQKTKIVVEDRSARPVDGRGRGSKIRMCIATGCAEQSKGPRFKYLCEAHKGSSEKKIANWRKSRAEMGMEE